MSNGSCEGLEEEYSWRMDDVANAGLEVRMATCSRTSRMASVAREEREKSEDVMGEVAMGQTI